MGVITFWNRLEPRPRSASIQQSLGAQVFDPLWFLTRQWQFGEFQGRDAGSPKFLEFSVSIAALNNYRVDPGQPFTPLDQSRPLEKLEAESWSPNILLQAELGQAFAALLEAEGAGSLAGAFLQAYPLPAENTVDPADDESLAFLRLTSGRIINGYAVYQAALKAAPALPAQPPLDASVKPAVGKALKSLVEWASSQFGAPGPGDKLQDAPSWRANRLEYGIELSFVGRDGKPAALAGSATPEGQFDWTSFDVRVAADAPPSPVKTQHTCLVPAHVRFRGMPNQRWWDFEIATRDFGAIDPQRRDLAKLTVMDFMLVQGNDWFCIPLSLPLGSAAWVDEMLVHDVFGNLILIKPAEELAPLPAQQRWSLFTASVAGDPRNVSSMLVTPPGAGSATQVGPVVEEVRFFRDEIAEMVWAVEEITENQIGGPWSGHERNLAHAPAAGTPSSAGQPVSPLAYRIETEVPENWIPFPPVSINPALGTIRWERAAMVKNGQPIPPVGRILTPAPQPYQIEEEEVPRTGVNLTRRIFYTRWIDGSAHLWVSRVRKPGAGEGSSGLHYDVAVPT